MPTLIKGMGRTVGGHDTRQTEGQKKRKEEKSKKAKKNALRFLLETYDGVVDHM